MNSSLALDRPTYAPDVSVDTIHRILRDGYEITQAKITQLTGYEDKNYLVDDIEYAENTNGPRKLILKISNPVEAQSPGHIDFQNNLCSILNEHGIPCPEAIRRKDGLLQANEEVAEGVHLPVRAFIVLKGKTLEQFNFTRELVIGLGKTLASFHNVADESKLTTTHMPFISADNSALLKSEAELLYNLNFLSSSKLSMVLSALSQYEKVKEQLEKGITHSDFNETNILIEDGKLCGVLDFGDVHIGPRVMDIATLILYLHLSDKLNQGISKLAQNVLEGYRSIRTVIDSQETFLICMRTRMACSLIYGLRTARMLEKASNDYVLKTQSNGWDALEKLLAMESLWRKAD